MRPITRHTLITATRDLLFLGLFFVIIVAAFISYFLGKTALVEGPEMVISYVAFSSRFILVIGLVVFVCFHVRRAFDNKEIEVQLSRPISRVQFVFEYWLGFVVLALITAIPLIIFMGSVVSPDINGLFFWGTSLIVECMLMVAFSLVASLMLQGAVSPVLLSLGFYVISRMMGYFMSTTKIPNFYSFDILLDHAAEYIVMLTSMFFPRLDFFAKSEWLIYGLKQTTIHEFTLFTLQASVYIPLLLGVAIFDFKRKQF